MRIETRIGQRIKELRAIADISQMKLADACDLDRTYINSIENGRRNVSIVNIEKIAKALNVSLKEFFDAEKFD